MLQQRTLKSLIRATGVGLHSGVKVTMTLRPAAPDTGIVFRRVDLDPPIDIAASALAVGDTRMASTVEHAGARVATVEHLMSALAGLGIDNCCIDVDAPEIPIMDGSAASFVFLLQSAGIEEQNAPKRFVRVLKTIEVREGEGRQLKWARLSPHFGFKLRFAIAFDHPAIDATVLGACVQCGSVGPFLQERVLHRGKPGTQIRYFAACARQTYGKRPRGFGVQLLKVDVLELLPDSGEH